MQSDSLARQPTSAEIEEFRCFRGVFTRAGYAQEALLETFGPIELPSHVGRDLPHFLHLTRQGRPLDTLIRLYLLGVPTDAEVARRALEPVPIEKWIQAGFLRRTGDTVFGLVRVLPFRGLLLACDHPDVAPGSPQLDQVMGVTNSTVALADFSLQRPSRKTLDLGTGCGVQAFLASRHSQQVYAVDRSARAIEFAVLNSKLNGLPGIQFLQGDAFEPVRGQRFNLVLSNPPFAVSPSFRLLYRDSGVGGDQFCRRILRESPQFLEEGGFCQITCDWAHIAGQDWKERVAAWFEGTGCDAWVLQTCTHDPAEYAHIWIRDTEHESPEASAELYEEWVSYYEREGIVAISSGLIAMRRSPGRANWVRIEESPERLPGSFGDVVAMGFELRDFLETVRPDERLLDVKLRLSPDLRLDQQCQWSEKKWRIVSAKLRFTRGLQYEGNINQHTMDLVRRCDGRQPLGDLLKQMAASLDVGLERIVPSCLPLVRQLIERGFLLPEDLGSDQT